MLQLNLISAQRGQFFPHLTANQSTNEPTDGSPDGNNEGMGPKPSSHTSSGQTPRPDKPTVDTTEHEATTSNTTTYRKQSRELESVKFVCICHG